MHIVYTLSNLLMHLSPTILEVIATHTFPNPVDSTTVKTIMVIYICTGILMKLNTSYNSVGKFSALYDNTNGECKLSLKCHTTVLHP